jgi:hypothetical protein
MHVLSTAKFEAQWQFASGITGVAGDIAGEKFSGAVAVESPEISSLTLSQREDKTSASTARTLLCPLAIRTPELAQH